jgi:hypothetical protein
LLFEFWLLIVLLFGTTFNPTCKLSDVPIEIPFLIGRAFLKIRQGHIDFTVENLNFLFWHQLDDQVILFDLCPVLFLCLYFVELDDCILSVLRVGWRDFIDRLPEKVFV